MTGQFILLFIKFATKLLHSVEKGLDCSKKEL